MANDSLREKAEAFDEPHDDKKYFQEWECFHYSNDAVYALMADFAAQETAELRADLEAAVRERDRYEKALRNITAHTAHRKTMSRTMLRMTMETINAEAQAALAAAPVSGEEV